MRRPDIHTATELMGYIQQVGFLPLLYSGIPGYSADEAVDPECRYVLLDDGSWDWPLWDWKGPIVTEGNCVYGKFFNKKETILMTLREHGSLITRDLRRLCGFTEPRMRSRFDGYVTRLQMACRVVTEDFVYPRDKHGHKYGWGWALLTTPEQLLGRHACQCDRTPQESFDRILDHMGRLLPRATRKEITTLIK